MSLLYRCTLGITGWVFVPPSALPGGRQLFHEAKIADPPATPSRVGGANLRSP